MLKKLATALLVYSRFTARVLNHLGTAGLQSYLDDVLTIHQGTWATWSTYGKVWRTTARTASACSPPRQSYLRPKWTTWPTPSVRRESRCRTNILPGSGTGRYPSNPRNFGYYRALCCSYSPPRSPSPDSRREVRRRGTLQDKNDKN